jgi:hypothetical protein
MLMKGGSTCGGQRQLAMGCESVAVWGWSCMVRGTGASPKYKVQMTLTWCLEVVPLGSTLSEMKNDGPMTQMIYVNRIPDSK